MNFVFIVDISFSMMQTAQYKISQLDIAKLLIEQFLRSRQNYPEAKYDRYFLLTTNSQYQSIILSSYEHDLSHFHFQLRNLVITHTTNPQTSILTAYSVINRFRIAFGCDNYLGGRDPLKIDNSMILFITDGTDSSYLEDLENILKSDKNYIRWDQQFHTILLNSITDSTIQRNTPNLANKNYQQFHNFCKIFGGSCYILENLEKIQAFTDNLVASIRHKLAIKFGVINLSKVKIDQNIFKYLTDIDASNTKYQQFLDQQYLSRIIIRLNTNQLTWRLGSDSNIQHSAFARIPLPENPIIPIMKPSINPVLEDLPNMAYPASPEFYVDLSKNCIMKFTDMPIDYYEIEPNCELYKIITDYMSNFPCISRINFPVFHIHNNTVGNHNENHDNLNSQHNSGHQYTFFAIIRYSKRNIDNALVVEFIVFPYNLIEFNTIWDETIRHTNALSFKIPPEYPTDFLRRLEIFFEKIPNYYSAYIQNWMIAKRMHLLMHNTWKYYTGYTVLKQGKITYEKFYEDYQEMIEKRLEIKQKSLRRNEENHQKHSMNISSCCDMKKITYITNAYYAFKKVKINSMPKEDAVEEQQQKTNDIYSISKDNLIDELITLRKKLFINKNHTIITKLIPDAERPIRCMSDYQKQANKYQSMRDPFADDSEKKFIKETLPFGNPFKYVVRQSNQHLTISITDEDVLLNKGTQKPNLDHNALGGYESNSKNTKSNYQTIEHMHEKNQALKKNARDKAKESKGDYEILQDHKKQSDTVSTSSKSGSKLASPKASPEKQEFDYQAKIKYYFSRLKSKNSDELASPNIFVVSQSGSKISSS